MKTTIRTNCLVLAGLMALAAPALAQGEDERRGQRRGGNPLLAALDRNGNGKLDAEEIDLAVASLRKLDRNKDGAITDDELPGQMKRLMDRLDVDGDKKITIDEVIQVIGRR